MQPSAVHRTPEIRIQLEIRAAPIAAHRVEHVFKMLLNLGIGSVERVPWGVPPTGERHFIRRERLAGRIFSEPLWMLLKHMRLGFCNKRRDPDSGFELSIANFLEHAFDIAAEGLPCFEPVAHS